MSDDGPTERALTAEEEYITDRLSNASCVEEWGLTAYGGIYENATITNRTADGVYVSVSHPYWYGTEQAEVDGGSRALYVITADDVRRVRGDDVSPC